MADQFIQVAPNSTGLKVDVSEIVVGANTVERQRVTIASDTVAGNIATVAAIGAADGEAGTDIALATEAYLKVFNGTTWDRIRTNGSLGGLLVAPTTPPAATIGGITTAATTVGPVTVSVYDGISVVVSGTYAGVNITFEASNDNAVWFPVLGARADTSISESTSGVLTANAIRQWDIALGEALYFRVRSTAFTSGSAAINIVLGMFAGDPVIAAIAHGVYNTTLPTYTAGTPAALLTDVNGRPIITGQGAAAAAVAGAPVRIGGTFTATLPTYTTTQQTDLQTTNRGETLVALSSGATAVAVKAASTASVASDPALVVAISPNNVLKVGDGTTAAVVTAASTSAAAASAALTVALSPNSPIVFPTPTSSIINSAATTNATSVKASAGTVYSVTASNTGATVAFVKLYNLATSPTVGTSTIVITIPVPAGGTVNLPFGTAGARFSTGIGLAITNLGTDADTTAVVAAQVKVITAYI